MQHPNILITPASLAHAALIADMAKTTFTETYGGLLDDEDLRIYFDVNLSESKIASELETKEFHFFVAWTGERTMGFFKLRRDRSTKGIRGKRCLEIERIYILKEFQGVSVGSEMIRMVKSIAKEAGDQVIWLQVCHRNDKAIQFYRQSGFVIYDTIPFPFGNTVHQDFLMRYDLYN